MPTSIHRLPLEASARASQAARAQEIAAMTAMSYRERMATIRDGIGSISKPGLRTGTRTAGQETAGQAAPGQNTLGPDTVGPDTVGTGTPTPAHSTDTLFPTT